MGWWPFNRGGKDPGPATTAAPAAPVENSTPSQPIFLDDIPAIHTENGNSAAQSNEGYSVSKEVKSFVGTLKPENFYMSNLVQIPCFREAGLSGFSCFFVFSTVIYFYHANLHKAVNWGFGGLLLGSIFGWEHCNNTRRNSQLAVRLAQERYEQNKLAKRAESEK